MMQVRLGPIALNRPQCQSGSDRWGQWPLPQLKETAIERHHLVYVRNADMLDA